MTNLQKIRKERGLTQAELAKRSGVSLKTIQALEVGRNNINKAEVMKVLRIADALECPVRNLMEAE